MVLNLEEEEAVLNDDPLATLEGSARDGGTHFKCEFEGLEAEGAGREAAAAAAAVAADVAVDEKEAWRLDVALPLPEPPGCNHRRTSRRHVGHLQDFLHQPSMQLKWKACGFPQTPGAEGF
mmetsp:Transcript_76064/g.158624  ORF Transcript_76064/g.158624 Transcript_76064/m.158624 type:complete len:121 (+) Transcript_76064:306-668(+)